jgi:hypothetical protein
MLVMLVVMLVRGQLRRVGNSFFAHVNVSPRQMKAYAFHHPLLAVPMVTIVTFIFGWSWYVHVLIMDIGLLRYGGSGVALGAVDVAVWHMLLLLAYISYLQTVLTQPGYTTNPGTNSPTVLVARPRASQSDPGRYCTECNRYKPSRCHHCRMCGRCVEKMDHHCPWVANCVGKYNHKFFVLFVSYTALTAMYNAATLVLWAMVYMRPAVDDVTQAATTERVRLSISEFFVFWGNVLITGCVSSEREGRGR